jgi:chromosome segregation ATPase
MAEWLKEYQVTINNDAPTVDTSLPVSLEQIKKQIADAEEQQNKICDLLEKGVYTIEMFSKRNEKIQADIKTLKEAAANIEAEIKAQETKKPNVEIIPKVQRLLDNYDIMTAQEKNDLWNEVLHKIDFYAEPKAKDFRFKLYPKI